MTPIPKAIQSLIYLIMTRKSKTAAELQGLAGARLGDTLILSPLTLSLPLRENAIALSQVTRDMLLEVAMGRALVRPEGHERFLIRPILAEDLEHIQAGEAGRSDTFAKAMHGSGIQMPRVQSPDRRQAAIRYYIESRKNVLAILGPSTDYKRVLSVYERAGEVATIESWTRVPRKNTTGKTRARTQPLLSPPNIGHVGRTLRSEVERLARLRSREFPNQEAVAHFLGISSAHLSTILRRDHVSERLAHRIALALYGKTSGEAPRSLIESLTQVSLDDGSADLEDDG